MRATINVAVCATTLLLSAACRSAEHNSEQDDLPTASAIDIPTPAEEAARAALEITDENVDEEFERLVAELGED